MMDWMNPCGGGMLIMIVWMVVWLVLIILAIVALVKWISGTRTKSYSNNDTALKILRKRYANGEISEEEFEERKKNLHK